MALKFPPHIKRVATPPCEILISKIKFHRQKHRNGNLSRTEENVIIVDGQVLSASEGSYKFMHSRHQVPQPGVVRIIFLNLDLGLECFQETSAKELIETNH